MVNYTNSCDCGERFNNNCAHFLSNWMIKNGRITTSPNGSTYNCKKGRPVRAKDMRAIFVNMGFKKHFNPPTSNCYIYCERTSDHQGHVYYGTKTKLVAGTLGAFGEYFEYYY